MLKKKHKNDKLLGNSYPRRGVKGMKLDRRTQGVLFLNGFTSIYHS